MSNLPELPFNPNFSSGPCSKRPNWTVDVLKNSFVGRSHRSKDCKQVLQKLISKSKDMLAIPEDYKLGIVPASDTGAVEMAMWSMLGARGVDVFAWESFGYDWIKDIEQQLKLPDVRIFKADYGFLPDLNQADSDRDIVFTWNGTTSGVKVPHSEWLREDREGIVICDATSAVFAMDIPWQKLDVVTYSWQKCMGGEAAHGMIALSPKALSRLESYSPPRAIPKIFRLADNGQVLLSVFAGSTINTPSMLCVHDALDFLDWAESVGGLAGLVVRSNNNLQMVKDWIAQNDWIDFLANDPDTISNTSICLKIIDSCFNSLAVDEQKSLVKSVLSDLEDRKVAYDIASYSKAPLGIRIWGGPTVESEDISKLLKWIDWSYNEQKKDYFSNQK